MELLANYDDGSNTPKADRNGEDSTTNMEAEYDRMMNSFEMGGTTAAITHSHTTTAPTVKITEESMPWLSKRKTGSGDSSSCSDSSSVEDSGSEDDEKPKQDKTEKHEGSVSSDYSTDSSSASGSSKHEKESTKQPIAERVEEKPKRASTSSSHMSSARKRSRSGSHGRRRKHSTERRRRSSSRSRDRRHRHHRSERKSSHRSRSRSRSKDRHRSRRSSKERRRRDSHRRRRSSSRDDHRRRRRRASSNHRRRHRSRSRSPEHKKHRPEKPRKSHSPSRSARSSREEEANAGNGPPSGVGGGRPPFRTAGLKFGRGRGNPNGFKEQLKKEFIQNCSVIQTAVNANPNQPAIVPPLMRSNVATTSAGLGGAAGDITTAILNQMQQVQKLVGQQPVPSGLTQEQMIINQQAILKATGRTKEQVEAETGIKVPEYYNEINYNVKEWAEREKKRKTLFKKKPEESGSRLNSQFSAKALLPGADSAQAEKFSRLLGVRKHMNNDDNQQKAKEVEEAERQDLIRDDLSKTYDSARVYTHLARGSGLGYTNTMYQPLG